MLRSNIGTKPAGGRAKRATQSRRIGPKAASKAAAPAVHKSQPVDLATDITVTDAFVQIARACREHWHANHAAAVNGSAAEGIHQFRVGLRRFRTALTLFGDYLPEAQAAWMKTEAKALADVVSEARDLDVFLTEIAPKAKDARGVGMIESAHAARRAAQVRIASTLQGARYRRFLTRLDVWLDGRGAQSGDADADGSAPAGDFARRELNRRLAKIQKSARALDRASAAELHRLRIAIKKLRYGFEFFHALLPPRRAARIGRLLKSLQDSLGHLNDLAVAERMMDALAAPPPSKQSSKPPRQISRADGSPRTGAGRSPRLNSTLKPLAKAARPEAVRVAARLREQRPL